MNTSSFGEHNCGMRNSLCLSLAILAFSLVGTEAHALCPASAQTQRDLNDSAGQRRAAAEREMNVVYTSLLKKLQNNPKAQAHLRKAQRAWIAYRDAQIEADFPSSSVTVCGSVCPMCIALEFEQLTRERTKLLERMIKPEEGDVCYSRVTNANEK
jgi:uncharacterized protein YecT (DUF1311 family)